MTFTTNDLVRAVLPHFDPLVLLIHIEWQQIRQVLIEGEAGVTVLYKSCFDKIEINKHLVSSMSSPIMGFLGSKI